MDIVFYRGVSLYQIGQQKIKQRGRPRVLTRRVSRGCGADLSTPQLSGPLKKCVGRPKGANRVKVVPLSCLSEEPDDSPV
ncbi:unnamed protein product [Calypogeia fissa]